MERDNVKRSVFLGHLTITVPAIAAILLVVIFGLYQFGPSLWPYYVTGGLGIAWQWYAIGLRQWKGSLAKGGVSDNETKEIGQHGSLQWPWASAVGSFALHTTAAAVCGTQFGPWLLSRWFVWIRPMIGLSSIAPNADYYLQHLELVSIVPAFVAGYVICRRFQKLAWCAWILPTAILAYKLLTFTNPQASVFTSSKWSAFSYYFVIERLMPTFYDLRGSDPVRVLAQMTVVVPFYSGVAYSIGACLEKSKVVDRIAKSLLADPEPEVFGPEEAGVQWIGDQKEQPTNEHR